MTLDLLSYESNFWVQSTQADVIRMFLGTEIRMEKIGDLEWHVAATTAQ